MSRRRQLALDVAAVVVGAGAAAAALAIAVPPGLRLAVRVMNARAVR